MRRALTHTACALASLIVFAVPVRAQAPLIVQPMHVRLRQFNWSSTFFPALLGGLDRGRSDCARAEDCWSPAQKLDHITGRAYDFPSQVRAYNRDAAFLQKFWTGYCDGIAMLQLSFPQLTLRDAEYVTPTARFTLTPVDVVGMAALAVRLGKIDLTPYENIGNRCTTSRLLPFRGPACRDLDALLFHRALTDEVAVGRSYAIDLSPFGWIDNNVITGYDLDTETLSPTRVRVTARVYTLKVPFARLPDIYRPKTLTHRYEYELTLDANGVPVSGSWNSQQPDFLWRQRVIRFSDEFSFLNQILNVDR